MGDRLFVHLSVLRWNVSPIDVPAVLVYLLGTDVIVGENVRADALTRARPCDGTLMTSRMRRSIHIDHIVSDRHHDNEQTKTICLRHTFVGGSRIEIPNETSQNGTDV